MFCTRAPKRNFDDAFTTFLKMRAGALVMGTDSFFSGQSEKLAALALRYAVPAIYEYRLIRGGRRPGQLWRQHYNSYRLAGVYSGRILKGEKPQDLPVQQSTKVELLINLRTAKTLGLTIPNSLLGRADEVIE